MIDLKQLREHPDRYRQGSKEKGIVVDFDRLLELDEARRELLTQQETRKAEQNRISKEIGQQLGKLKAQLKSVEGGERTEIEARIRELEEKPLALKAQIQDFEHRLAQLEPEWRALWLQVPQPPATNVPKGTSSDDNVEIRRWNPAGFDPERGFEACRGFKPRTHLELVRDLKLVDFERGVKMSGTRHYVLTGWGMRLHQAVLRMAFEYMVLENGFQPMSVPVIVREDCMVGTGFFPAGREQAYHIEESRRGESQDLFLTGTGEVGLMGLHSDEILPGSLLPLRYITVSTCFRREAGAAGKDTAGLYRIHQFDKVEQVVICRADDAESRSWHTKMIGYVETILQRLELPYRLLQCCTGDLGTKNEDMIDVECWMPGRGENGSDGRPGGAYGETHSASRLADYQCRRLNMRYKDEHGKTVFCWSLNNTVLASPRILIPLLEMHQQADGTVNVPDALRPFLGGTSRIS